MDATSAVTMGFKRLRDTLRQAPLLTIFALVLFVGLIAYAVLHGTGGSASPTASNLAPGTPLGPSVIFVSPLEGASVTNPVSVRLAIGGIRYQKAGEPVKAGYGHLGVIVDGSAPAVGATFIADATHLDLSDGSHNVTLPALSPGPHTLTAVFANSNDVIGAPLVTATISIIVMEASPS